METHTRKFHSPSLGTDLEYKVYGSGGKPVMAFPSYCGRFFDYENFGMVAALESFIDAGDLRVFAVDGRDEEGWHGPWRGTEMGRRHRAYELAVAEDAASDMRREFGVEERFLATGCSFGAYHALNFCMKFPERFDSCVCLSGIYSLRPVIGNYYDDSVYFNDPSAYLSGLSDEALLAKLRRGYFIVCHGLGSWEIDIDVTREVCRVMAEKGLPAWYSVWGERYQHDWWAWKEQAQRFFHELRAGVVHPEGAAGKLRLVGPERRKLPL